MQTAYADSHTPVVNKLQRSTPPSRLVQMRLLNATVEAVDHVKQVLNASNRTDAVVRCIDIARTIIDAIQLDGMTVQLVGRDGTVERLVIPGLTPRRHG